MTTNWYGVWRIQKPLECHQRNYSYKMQYEPKILILTSLVFWKESIRFSLIFITKIPAWCFFPFLPNKELRGDKGYK